MNTSKRDQVVITWITGVKRNLARIRHQLQGGGEPVDEQPGNRDLDPAAQPWTLRQDGPILRQQPGARYHPEGIAFQPCVDDAA